MSVNADQPANNRNPLIKNALIALAILAVGIAAAVVIVKSAPKPKKVKPEIQARLVEATDLRASENRPSWRTGGQVMASQQVMLTPQVSGRIIRIDEQAVPGARLAKGALLAKIDPADYQYQLAQSQAAYTQALAALDIEKGQASLAKEEYELSAARLSQQDRALVLREPQIAQAQAQVKTAKANLEQARLNLARTEIRMPFAGQINSRSIAVGSQVSSATNAFDLVNTDEFWIEVKIPAAFLTWLDRDHPVVIRQPGWGSQQRQARVLNVLPAVDSADRQVKLVLSLSDPLARDNPQQPVVLLNDFVDVQLFARALPDSYEVPTRFLDDDHRVWVVQDGELQQRTLNVLYKGRETSWVSALADEQSGFRDGDQLLASRVDAAVPGAPVRVLGAGNDGE